MRFASTSLLSVVVAWVPLLALVGCGGDDDMVPTDGGMTTDATVEVGDGGERNGCNVLRTPVAMPGDPIDGDTYATYATGFFTSYCVRCHSTTLVGPDRNGAPDDRNWDDESSVRMYLPLMRQWVGELNAMPLSEPFPTCDERLRFVRWLDADAP